GMQIPRTTANRREALRGNANGPASLARAGPSSGNPFADPRVSPSYSHQQFRGTPPVRVADLDLLQGTLDLLILKTLTWGPRHGYAVASWIRDTTEQRLQIEEGALYTALHRMEKRGWLEADWGLSENNRKAKFYQLTAQGRRQLRAQTAVRRPAHDAHSRTSPLDVDRARPRRRRSRGRRRAAVPLRHDDEGAHDQ